MRKIRPSIDTTMDQQKSLHHHKLSDGSLHKILVNKQAVQELHANIEESKLMLCSEINYVLFFKACFIFQIKHCHEIFTAYLKPVLNSSALYLQNYKSFYFYFILSFYSLCITKNTFLIINERTYIMKQPKEKSKCHRFMNPFHPWSLISWAATFPYFLFERV